MKKTQERRLVTTRRMAELLSMSPTWLRLQFYAGKIPGHKLGRSLRFDPVEVFQALGLEASQPEKAE